MNKDGHPETLVAAHPGNANALKSGVFSQAARMQRVHEIEGEISARDTNEVVTEVLRREVAALAALSEVMDESLANDGIRGRSGDPRNLVTLRFRLNDRLRRSLDAYAAAMSQAHPGTGEASEAATDENASPYATLVETIARFHMRDSINEISPAELDPEQYLRAVVITTDARVTDRVRLNARRMLTKLTKQRRPTCVCFATVRARDAIELRDWINDARSVRDFEPSPADAKLAVYVRAMARGDRSELPAVSTEMEDAFRTVVLRAVSEALDPPDRVVPQRNTGERDGAIRAFWRVALSPKETLAAKDRLEALAALDELGVLPKCTCGAKKTPVLREMRLAELYVYVIRIVAETHFRAAVQIAHFPETALAVRNAIDDAILKKEAEAARSGA